MKKALYLTAILLAGFFFMAFRRDEIKDSGLYKIDQSKSGVTWEGKKVIGGHNGTIQIKEGSVNYNGYTITSGTFTIDMSTIKSLDLEGEKKTKLEHHLMSPDFFDAGKYPLTTFKIKKVERRTGDQAWATGMLTIKETTREISFPITMSAAKGRLDINAKNIKVDRTKFGVVFASRSLKASIGDKAIDDEFTIGFSLVLMK
ncbi:YceI family protein [Taibaiella helva]|uniref:YceI family protein n=1 Tax=Taibaiella helva TaxID=2301235 RepID=UPI000E56E0C6|nr:YceI family protein [Taibaiella helva]